MAPWMRAPAMGALVLALLPSAGCSERRDAGEQASAENAREEPPSDASDPFPKPLSPTPRESLAACAWDAAPAALRARLVERRFEALDEAVRDLHAALEREPACEVLLFDVYELLVQPANLPPFDAFVAALPESWVARALRGAAYVSLGLARRGTAFASQVSDAQWEGMREAFASAGPDLEASLSREPANLIASLAALEMARQFGDRESVLAILQETLEHHPLTYNIRVNAMRAISPYYGGSLDAMAELAQAARPLADRNPRLRGLPGRVASTRARLLWGQGKLEEALAENRRALGYVASGDAYWMTCSILLRLDRPKEALAAADRWIASHGDDGSAHVWRGKALVEASRSEAARAAFERAAAAAPDSAWVHSQRSWFLEQSGDLDAAARSYRRAADLAPDDVWVARRLAQVLSRLPERTAAAEQALRGWAELAPQSLAPQFHLGRLLHRQGDPRAPAVLRGYVARAAGDGEEAARLAIAKRLLSPPSEGRLPALEHLGLVSEAGALRAEAGS